ncbi:hypothetical protein IGI04_035847 [Brassica rapa subsp. trilocularis]|uniref:Uncharacterized protein n=1 Tax=Brassica rapa subsp. trilocularis TaxID=1813537 RepID=A0ABQ7LCS4_BRACM|nr:hypothetical protein IGI04_035847 [Brassica rapa subsp. trilocularis]
MKHSPNVLFSYLCFSEEHPQPVCEDSEDSFSETIQLLIVSFPLKVLLNYLKGWVLVRVGLLMRCESIDGGCVVTIDVGLTLSIDVHRHRSTPLGSAETHGAFDFEISFLKVKNSSGHFGNLAWPWFLSLLNPKCRVWCLDIDRRYLCTSIDINLHLSRHFLISIVSTDAHRSIILPLVDL